MKVDRLKDYFNPEDWNAFHKRICIYLVNNLKFMFEHNIRNGNYLQESYENIIECFDRVKNFSKDKNRLFRDWFKFLQAKIIEDEMAPVEDVIDDRMDFVNLVDGRPSQEMIKSLNQLSNQDMPDPNKISLARSYQRRA